MHNFGEAEEDAGALELYRDPALYDREYRNRRTDIAFYRMLADERLAVGTPSAILELACGTGRLTMPLLRAGHRVVGLDRSGTMLDVARRRVQRLPRIRRENALFFRADMRDFAIRSPVSFVLAGFHSLQHLITDADLVACFRNVRASLRPDGWFVFDVLPPHPEWLGSAGEVRFNRKAFRHPKTGERIRYGSSHLYDPVRRALHMQLLYQPVDDQDGDVGTPHVVKLCHRQLWPGDLEALLAKADLEIIARYSDFDPAATETAESLSAHTYEHIFIAKPRTTTAHKK